MLRRLFIFALSLFVSSFAAAQHSATSRLDVAQSQGKLRVCTLGDYKPFSLD